MTRPARLVLRSLGVLLALALLAVLAGWWAMRGSLASLDGELALPGLSAPVTVERDALGSATIHATNETDAARALGYVHAQERFFEMDLLRRSAAGELSELFGAIAVDRDKAVRVHRMRARVHASLAEIAGDRLPLLQAYTDGVNAGLKALRAKPWPYLLLRTQPQPWQPEDTGLAGYAMFFDLQDESNSRELALQRIQHVVPPALYALIAHDGSAWDAPISGRVHGDAVLPTAAELDLRRLPTPPEEQPHGDAEPAAPGSNNFAVDGTLTADGRAILANDMHLQLRAPNLWFRARLVYPDAKAPGGQVDVAGFTLPGTPLVVVGSNRHVAWGFTNSYGDWADWVRPATGAATHTVHERIRVKGGDDIDLTVEETPWGPVTGHDAEGKPLALYWIAHQPGSLTLGLAEFARARDVDQALAMSRAVGIPEQNLLLADEHGAIAWKLTGRIPQRGGRDPRAVVDGNEVKQPWAEGSGPSITRPAMHRLWTANARTLDGADLAAIGDAGYANGARARQIRDVLFAKPRFAERDLLAIQLDDRALFLQRWWTLLRARATHSSDPAWRAIEAATRQWEGRAAPDAVSYRITRAWRRAVVERIRHGLVAPAMVALGGDFVMPDMTQLEGVAWPLVTQRPPHLLPRRFASWDALELDAAQAVVADLGAQGPLARRSWGEENTASICHPLARALPGLAKRWLCMPPDALAGDGNMPRVVAPNFGASERMVVSPGHEADGIVHMPGGASGNPLSPYWGAGHTAWVRGEATPFLPGPARHRLTFTP